MNYRLKNKKMKKYISLITLLSSSIIFSQIKMSGKVTDSIGTPLELANIILIDSMKLFGVKTHPIFCPQ